MTAKKPSIRSTYSIDWNIKRWGRGKMAPAPEYVVIHFTGSGGKGGTAAHTYSGWLAIDKDHRCNTHYLVDAGGIYECVDPKKYACLYACASKKCMEHINFFPGSTMACSHINVAGNYNTINIEACSAKRSPVSRRRNAYMDDDFYFPDATYSNLVALTSWLLDEFGIPLSNLIMHHQISGKLCPAMWCNSETAFNGWSAFKGDVAKILNKPAVVKDLGAPIGAGTESGTGSTGTIQVRRGDPYYMDPEGVIILGYIEADAMLQYSSIKGNMYYTKEGYVRGGS